MSVEQDLIRYEAAQDVEYMRDLAKDRHIVERIAEAHENGEFTDTVVERIQEDFCNDIASSMRYLIKTGKATRLMGLFDNVAAIIAAEEFDGESDDYERTHS